VDISNPHPEQHTITKCQNIPSSSIPPISDIKKKFLQCSKEIYWRFHNAIQMPEIREIWLHPKDFYK
jgi:hypothetical protein